jgi:hypothetical protein
MTLIGAGLAVYLRRRLRTLDKIAERTEATQLAQWRSLIDRARDTEFGRSHEFARIRSIDDYRRAVPLRDWYGFKSMIDEMLDGRPDVLWPGLVQEFAQTSGTTAGDKFIPVSDAMFRSNQKAALDIFAHLMRRGMHPSRLFGGKLLFMGGSTKIETNAAGLRIADLSGLAARGIFWPVSRCYLPGQKIGLLDHWPTKIERMAEQCLDADVRFASGMPSWMMILWGRMLELARERGRDVQSIGELWPNFNVLIHGGVNFRPFIDRVETTIGLGPDQPMRHEVYPASEGFIAMQDASPPSDDPHRWMSLRLLTDVGIYYEFVPLEEIDQPDARAFAAHEVEKGQRYVVVMSTCAGLFRYIIGDVVEFDTLATEGEPVRLRIVGRHRHFINAFGENIIVEHIEQAVARASEETGAQVAEFTAAPIYPRAGRSAGLELVIEWLSDHAMIDAFRDAFDAAIKDQNIDYTTKRTSDMGMAPPTITPVPVGTFHRWLDARGKLGGQHKIPRCANNREILEAVLEAVP